MKKEQKLRPSIAEMRKLLEDVHGAGYHDALTRVDPKQSQADTVAAAIERWRQMLEN